MAAWLAACASTDEPRSAWLDSWHGASEREVARAWGKPTRAEERDGRRVLVYDTRTEWNLPGPVSTGGVTGPLGGNTSMSVATWCRTTFEFSGLVVVQVAVQGNGCARGKPSSVLR